MVLVHSCCTCIHANQKAILPLALLTAYSVLRVVLHAPQASGMVPLSTYVVPPYDTWLSSQYSYDSPEPVYCCQLKSVGVSGEVPLRQWSRLRCSRAGNTVGRWAGRVPPMKLWLRFLLERSRVTEGGRGKGLNIGQVGGQRAANEIVA